MPETSLRGKNILIVAEPGQMIDGICSRLRTQGVSIEFITSGFQAISMIEKDAKNPGMEFQLIILFENCLDMPQREVLNLVRLTYPAKKLPILCLSKETNVDDIKVMLQEGSSGFLVDYGNFNKVLDKIGSVIQ